MSQLVGRYKNLLDEKGRVSVPSAFRRALSGGDFVLLHWRGSQHLTLLTEEAWADVQEKLLGHRRATRDLGASVRSLSVRSTSVSLDKHGRIRVPRWLLESARLSDTVTFVGGVDRIELWNPTRLADHLKDVAEDAERFAAEIFS